MNVQVWNMDINLIESLLLESRGEVLSHSTQYMIGMDTIVQPSPQSGRPMGCSDFRSR
jgi:hypothetical protein